MLRIAGVLLLFASMAMAQDRELLRSEAGAVSQVAAKVDRMDLENHTTKVRFVQNGKEWIRTYRYDANTEFLRNNEVQAPGEIHPGESVLIEIDPRNVVLRMSVQSK